MIGAFLQFALAAAAIVIAGSFLVRSADKISEVTRLGRLFAGSILLAGATSLPELLVGISAIRNGMPDLAVGDIMGASLMNLLIIAIADLVQQSPRKMFSRASAQHALSAALSSHLTVLAAITIFLAPYFSHISIGEIGLGPLVLGLSYIIGLRLVYHDQQALQPKGANSQTPASRRRRDLAYIYSIYLLSAFAILIAAPFLADAAGEIADKTGLGKTFIGSSLVAISTALPEAVATFSAVRIGALDLAIGNAFGSISFNMALLVPFDLIQKENLLSSVSRVHILTALATALATSVVVMGQLYGVETRRRFIEPDATLVVAIVLGALFTLYKLGAT